VFPGQANDLLRDTEAYVSETLRGNSYLRQQGRLTSRYLADRPGYTTQLTGRSPVSGETEIVTVYTAQLRTGQLFYAVTVAPQNDAYNYTTAFRNVLNSIRLNDQ